MGTNIWSIVKRDIGRFSANHPANFQLAMINAPRFGRVATSMLLRGNNQHSDADTPARGLLSYLWLGKYFSHTLYREGLGWLFSQDPLLKTEEGYIPRGLLTDADLGKLLQLKNMDKHTG